MKGFLIFISGFAVGILFTFFVIFIISFGSSNLENKVQVQVQYVDIKGKKGNARLYTGMPKDSVLILVGKPDEVNLSTIGSETYEDWGYKLKNTYVSDLDIDFVNGKLKAVRQN